MNKIKNIAFGGCVAAALLATTSCEDWLTITPTTQIVEEEFWEDKSDLQSVVSACYLRMAKDDVVGKIIQYGETRSDNVTPTRSQTDELHNMMNANLLPSDGYGWESFYSVINFCNKVLEHGDGVVATDESFSNGDWLPMRAEVTALRALSYFYLVRIWRDVPLVLTAYDNDSQDFNVAQSSQIEVLNNQIESLDAVKDQAMDQYAYSWQDYGRITKVGIYALLADMYLWRAAYYEKSNPTQAAADYQKVVECCDFVINKRKAELQESLDKETGGSGSLLGVSVTDAQLLMSNYSSTTGGSSGITVGSGAYNEIFGDGNSLESIFELQMSNGNPNNAVSSYYGHSTTPQVLGSVLASKLFQSAGTSADATSQVYSNTDMRRWENTYYGDAAQTMFPISKYVASSVIQSKTDNNAAAFTALTKPSYTLRSAGESMTCNWIVYRMSEIFLMKAEAISRLYPSDAVQLERGFHYVSEVYKRSNPDGVTKGDTLKASKYTTGSELEALVLRERQRELAFEGKRWFDLVRLAQRNSTNNATTQGTNDKGVTVLTTNSITPSVMLDLLERRYETTGKAVRSKLSTMDALFAPISKTEMDKAPLLRQNKAWANETTSSTKN